VKRLYRSGKDRYIGGVAGGMAQYFGIDANLMRILLVLFAFVGGVGLVLYLVALFIVPENPSEEPSVNKPDKRDRNFLLAIILIVIGSLLLLKEFGLFHYFQFWNFRWSSLWAIFLIVLGVLLIVTANRKKNSEEEQGALEHIIPDMNKIRRSRTDRIIAGVCAGIANYFNIDPAIVRLLWVLGTFASIGLGILVYVILIFIFPEQEAE
jgi:phage shock protein C